MLWPERSDPSPGLQDPWSVLLWSRTNCSPNLLLLLIYPCRFLLCDFCPAWARLSHFLRAGSCCALLGLQMWAVGPSALHLSSPAQMSSPARAHPSSSCTDGCRGFSLAAAFGPSCRRALLQHRLSWASTMGKQRPARWGSKPFQPRFLFQCFHFLQVKYC